MTKVVIPTSVARQVEREGVEAYPRECCGILVGREVSPAVRVVERLVPMRNTFDEKEQYHRFTVDPLAQIDAERSADAEGRVVLGYYHSHPDSPARPSEYDRQHMPPWSFYSQVIVSIVKRRPAEMTAWSLNEDTEQFDAQEIVVE
jgi:proteasome lid subunit RPN8/RPN11